VPPRPLHRRPHRPLPFHPLTTLDVSLVHPPSRLVATAAAAAPQQRSACRRPAHPPSKKKKKAQKRLHQRDTINASRPAGRRGRGVGVEPRQTERTHRAGRRRRWARRFRRARASPRGGNCAERVGQCQRARRVGHTSSGRAAYRRSSSNSMTTPVPSSHGAAILFVLVAAACGSQRPALSIVENLAQLSKCERSKL